MWDIVAAGVKVTPPHGCGQLDRCRPERVACMTVAAARPPLGRAARRRRRRGARRHRPGRASRPWRPRSTAAVRDEEHLLVQAGTGTGKSLAYLVPALLVDGPVVVSTATLALQHQLVDHDLPRLADAVAPAAGPQARPSPSSRDATTTCVWPNWTVARPRSRTGSSTRRRSAVPSGWARPAGWASRSSGSASGPTETETGDRDELDPGVDDTRLAAGLDAGPRVRRRDAVPVRRGVLRRGVARPGPRGRHRGDQPQPARVRHAGRAAHHPDRTGCSSSTRRTSWPTGSARRARPS